MPVINYLWNPLNDNIVRKFDDAGTVLAEYTTEANQFRNVISQRRNGQDSVYHYDGQGSTLALTDANGDVTDTYSYSAFGEVTARTGSTPNPFQYIGREGYYRDTETGDYEVRRRAMRAQIGRWFALDQELHHFSNYMYALNSPLFATDPSGEAPLPLIVNDGNPDHLFCAGCTGYLAIWKIWKYTVPTDIVATYRVVQHLTTYWDKTYCPPFKDCAGSVTCRDTGFAECYSVVYEYLGKIIVTRQKTFRYISKDSEDHWDEKLIGGSGKNCESRGSDNNIATVRAFKENAFPEPSLGVGWKKGTANCNYGLDNKTGKPTSITYGYYLTAKPIWWKDSVYEAEVKAVHTHDCCKPPAVAKNRRILAFRGEKQHCHQERLLAK